jgi:AcrR family transcriptional regulator
MTIQSRQIDAGPVLSAAHPVDGGRRDRKKHATRQALRRAALQLVAELGYAHVTVEDIAEAADVSTRTFFNYFPSKESAVIGADPDRVEEMRVGLLSRPAAESPLEALRVVLVGYATAIAEEIDDLDEGRDAWFNRLCVVRKDQGLRAAYSAHIAEIESGLVDALAERLGMDPLHDPYPAVVTAAALAVSRVAALYWAANGGVESLALLTERALDGLQAGLSGEGQPFRAVRGPGPSQQIAGRSARPSPRKRSQLE